ncbi:MAG TPA: TIGR00296 family protein [archaeon]|nr:TIGR00296 family protein [archaeon]
MLSSDDKKFLLALARETIEKFARNEKIEKPTKYPEVLNQNHGVFCTLTKNGNLRGCIGMPYPAMPLIKSLISSACSACEDSRFRPLREAELKEIKIELSVLTEPNLIEAKGDAIIKSIKIGEDGLIIHYGPYSGLLLPQVAAEHKWSAEKFLDNLCIKAGLAEGMWRDPRAVIYKFQADVFSE